SESSRPGRPHAKSGISMSKPEASFVISPRPSETVSVQIPLDVIEALRTEAAHRDMSVEALLRFYIGSGLRQDLSRHYSDRLLDSAAKVLSEHITSQSEVSEILREIREKASPNVPGTGLASSTSVLGFGSPS